MISLLQKAVQMGASDVFVVPGACVSAKVNAEMVDLGDERLTPARAEELIRQMYELAHRDLHSLEKEGDDDFSFAIRDVSRFRCNIYRQRGSLAAVFRVVCPQRWVASFPVWEQWHDNKP